MNNKRHRPRFLLAALALFLAAVQPFAAQAAEPAVQGEDVLVCTVQLQTAPVRFLLRLGEETDHGRPRNGTTRGQYIQLLYEAVGAPAIAVEPFYSDVSMTDDYAAAVTWARLSGIVEDGGADLFYPGAVITLTEADQWLTRTLSALAGAANQVANSLLAAYTGRAGQRDLALTPAEIVAALEELLSDTRLTLAYPAAISGEPPQRARTLITGGD